jgi:hypothetical protein
MFHVRWISSALLCGALALQPFAATAGDPPEWRHLTPGNTSIPGELVDLSAFDDDGNLWAFARFVFFQDFGLAMLPASSIPYLELPGGGFDTCCWTVWSNRDDPIPSEFVHSMRIAPDGVIWIASDAGLTRFDRNATPPASVWTTYDQSNAPFVVPGVRSVDLAADGTLWLTNTSVNLSNGAVFHFDPVANTWTQYQVGAEIDWGDDQGFRNVGYVRVGPDGHVWATHQVLSGLAEFDGNAWTLHTECSAQLDGMLADPDGNIWIASAQQGLWRWDGTACANWPTLGGDMTILAMSFDEPNHTFYAANFVGGIFRTSNDGASFDPFVDNDGIIPIGIHPRPGGDVWVAYNQQAALGAQGGIVHYDSAGSRIEAFNAINTGLPSYLIDRTFVDTTGRSGSSRRTLACRAMTEPTGAISAATTWVRNRGRSSAATRSSPRTRMRTATSGSAATAWAAGTPRPARSPASGITTTRASAWLSSRPSAAMWTTTSGSAQTGRASSNCRATSGLRTRSDRSLPPPTM